MTKPPDFRRVAASQSRIDASSAATQSTHPVDYGVVLVSAATLEPRSVRWLWDGWLALGKFQLLAGPAGHGKTTVALAMAATVSVGGRWPDGSICPQGQSLIWSGEDDAQDTLLPRLLAMGADPSRVHFIHAKDIEGRSVPFDPARDLGDLTSVAVRLSDVHLIVIDPVVSAVAGDSHKNSEVRRGLQPLVDLAASLGATVLGISHFSKGTTGRDPVERVTGSVAFGALARIVLCAVKLPSDEDEDVRRVLIRAKSNIGPDVGGFEYFLDQTDLCSHPGVSASMLRWGGPVAGSATELLAQVEKNRPPEAPEFDLVSVENFLRGLLHSGHAVAATEVYQQAAEVGRWSAGSVRRAGARLRVVKAKASFGGGWTWRLPRAPSDVEGAQDAEGAPHP